MSSGIRDNGFIFTYLPVVLCAGVIFVSSSIPSEAFPKVEFWGWAKLVHVAYYFVLALLTNRALLHQRTFPLLSRHPLLFSFLFALLYGATDEFHQQFTPGRHAQLLDVLIDGFGALLSIGSLKASRLFRTEPRELVGNPQGKNATPAAGGVNSGTEITETPLID